MYKRLFLGLLFLLASVTSALAADARPKDRVLEAEVPSGGDFTLQSVNGPVSTEDLRGKVIMLYFGYTKCPDVCPTSLSFMTQALNGLTEEELKKVVGIFVSVDPKRDTLETLDQYVHYFHKNFIGVTGSPEEVAAVAKLYGAKYYEVKLEGSAFGYSVNHSSVTYLIDSKGELKLIFPHETPPSVMLEGLRYLIAED
jgi:protein SCO1